MNIKYIRVIENLGTDGWTFAFCDSPEPDAIDHACPLTFPSVGAALDGAVQWCKERELTLDWFVPMEVWAETSGAGNVVEASHRFGASNPYQHPSRHPS
jgi:hypothetical protein